MKYLLPFCLLVVATILRSQGEPILADLHGDKDSKKKITDKVILRELDAFYPSYDFDNDREKTPDLKRLTKIPIAAETSTSITLRNDSLVITIESKPFKPQKHKLGYDKHYKDFLQTVDGRPLYGTDGNIPSEAITGLTISRGTSKFSIPKAAYTDLFEPNYGTTTAFLSKDGRRLYLYMMNSDGAGAYEIVWIFKDGKYFRRVVEHNC